MKRFKGYAIPYFVWLVLFVVVPLFVMLILTFLQINAMDFSTASFSFDSYFRLADPSILKALWNSLVVAVSTVVICLLLGYPYFLSFSKLKNKKLVLLLMILPMWSNSMLRIVSWLRLFSTDFFAAMNLLGSTGAVIAVTVTTYLPFMIFPIYTILEKLDRSCLEASRDLGVNAFKTFFKVTVPMMMSGVISGAILSWIMIITELSTSIILYTSKTKTMTLEIYSQIIRGSTITALAPCFPCSSPW